MPYGFAVHTVGGMPRCAVRTGARHDTVPPPQRIRAQYCCAHGSVAGESAASALTCSYYDKQQIYGGGLVGQRRDQHDERRVVNERHAALIQVTSQSSCDEWTQVQPRAHTRASGPNSCGCAQSQWTLTSLLTANTCSHGKKVPSPVLRDSLRPGAKSTKSALGEEDQVFGGGKPSWMSAPIKPGQFAGSPGRMQIREAACAWHGGDRVGGAEAWWKVSRPAAFGSCDLCPCTRVFRLYLCVFLQRPWATNQWQCLRVRTSLPPSRKRQWAGPD